MQTIKKLGYILGTVFITFLGLCGVWLLAIRLNINIDGIKSAMENSGYYDDIEVKISKDFSNYIESEHVQDILSKIPIKENINYILSGIDDNTVELIAQDVKQEAYNIISRSLKDKTSEENIELFSKTMSERYVKTLLPISYFAKYGELYVKYVEKIDMIIALLLITAVILFVLLVINGESFKYGVVALYNIVIISIYILLVLLFNKSFALGDIRLLVEKVVDGITIEVGLELIIIMMINIFVNYIRYFKKSNK